MTGYWKFSVTDGGVSFLELKQTGEAITSPGRSPITGTLHNGKLHLESGVAPRLTVYDATYLELALRLSLPLATLDGDLRKAAELEGVLLLGL